MSLFPFFKNKFPKYTNLTIFFLLVINLIIRLVIYFNTKLFFFSDYQSYLNAIDLIHEDKFHHLQIGAFSYLNSYLGYFFKYLIGSIDYYFIFNAFLGVASIYIISLISLQLFNSTKVQLISVLILTFYNEFSVIGSLFYTQVIEVFFISTILLLTIRLIKQNNYYKIVWLLIAIVVLLNLSLFFKASLKYYWILLVFYSLVLYLLRKEIRLSLRFFLLSLTLIISTSLLPFMGSKIKAVVKPQEVPNDFIFFGHTLYGGNGGEGSFIYQENKIRYDENLKAFISKNNIKSPDRKSVNKFQAEEIRKFIKESPHKWVMLQIRKVLYTFSSIPIGDAFKILNGGLFPKNQWYFSVIFLQFPFMIIILLFAISFNWVLLKQHFSNSGFIFYSLIFIYFLIAICFYGQYQERYRIPLVSVFIIPMTSFFLEQFSLKSLLLNRRMLIYKAILAFSIIIIWGYQIYEVLIIDHERYFNVLNK